MSGQLVQEILIHVKADGTHEIVKTAGALDQLGTKAQAAGAKGAAGMQQFAGATQALRGAVMAALGPIALITAAIAGFQKAISAASDADKSIRQLANTLDLAGSSMERDGARIHRTIKRLFDSTLYDDEALQDAFGNLLTMTGDVERALQALPVATNLAAKTGEELGSAMQTIGMAAEGATRGLRKLGISFTAAESEAFGLMSEGRRLEIVLGLINEKTSGAARVDVAAWGGELKTLGRGLGEIWEKVGGAIFTALTAMDRYFTGIRASIREALGLSNVVSGGHTSAGLGRILSGDEARNELAKGVAAGIEAGARLGGPRAARIVADALRQIPGLNYPSPRSLGDVLRGMDQVFDVARIQEILSRTAFKIPVFPEIVPSALQRIGRELSAQLGVTFGTALTDIFADLAETGGRNFGQIASQAFGAGIKSAAEAFGSWVVELLGGGPLTPSIGPGGQAGFDVGGQFYGSEAEARTAQGQDIYGRIAQGVTGTIAGIQGIRANQAGQMNDTQTIMSQIAIGASIGSAFALGIGTVIGAVVGVIVGIISAIGSSSADTDQYARVGVRDGRAFFENPQNITANAARAAQAQLQSTFDEYRNGYIQILLQFPEQFRTGLMEVLRNSANIFPRLGLDAGGDIGTGGSLNFIKHYTEWVNGRLPRQIAETLFEPLATAFEGVGLSNTRFREIWDDLQDLDPRKAMELLGILAEGLIDIYETMNLFAMPSGFRGRYSETDPTTLRGRIQSRDQRSFAATLAETDEEIFSLAESLEMLTGEDQIRTVQRIGQLMQERYTSEEEYIRGIIRMIEDSTREIDAAIRGYQLDSITDPQGQVDYLTQYLEGLYTQLGGAGTPDAANLIYREIFDTIQQIAAIGGAISPEDRQQFNAWAIAELQGLGTLYQGILANFGQQLDAVNAAFVSRMGPMLDAFDGVAGVASSTAQALSEVASSAADVTDGFYTAATAARDFAAAASELDFFSASVRASRAA